MTKYDEMLARRKLREGFTVDNPDAISLIKGRLDGRGLLDDAWSNEWFLSRTGESPRKLVLNRQGRNLSESFIAEFSSDRRYAVVDGTPSVVPENWERYQDVFLQQQIRDWRLNGEGGFLARQLKQLYLIDLERGTSRPLLDSPNPSSEQDNVHWSADARTVIVGPTFAPLALRNERTWTGHAFVKIDVKSGGAELMTPAESMDARQAGLQSRGCATAVRVEMREDRARAPALYVVDENTGRAQMVLDPNQHLRERIKLGKVDTVSWTDVAGRTWSGLLYFPTDYSSTRRYPLVIQTHGYEAPTRFSLHGVAGSGGLGPGMSLYAAQPLANRGIAVLQMQDRKPSAGEYEPHMYQEGYEAAASFFSRTGLADLRRIGLSGFSRTGWHVQYALTHSSFSFAAAIVSDNIDGSYLQATLFPGYFHNEIGALPYGDGLQPWLQRAPGFNVQWLRVPLRLQVESQGLAATITQWEVFSRARHLKKPIELYVVPDVERGSHHLQNPRQLRAIQQGAVDWYDFWLNRYEDPDPSKSEQFIRWRQKALSTPAVTGH